ncbi:MAG TPA: glycosyltransferase [Acidobacteriaceae bacterium]|nr:glycosyltransferase [Acidobacteriaceae bacterium]
MLLVLAALSLISWFWLLLLRGWFWLSGPTLPRGTTAARPLRVTAIVPARNEAEHIAATLRSLLAQQFPGDLRVVLVNDNSSDGTGDLARRISAEDPRVSVVAGEPLPPGWTGKMWAVAQGLRHPEAAAADYILLTDGDIVHEPHHVAVLVAKAEADGIALVSEMVRLRCRTFAERATIPAFVFFFQMLYPFRWVGDRRHTTAAAAGGTMLVSRHALDSIGGVDRIRAALIDDVALAREIKRAGYAIWLGHAEQAQSRRTYSGFGEVWSMIARTAYVQLRCSPALLLGTCAGMLLLYAIPVIAAFAAIGPARWIGIVAWTLIAIAFQPTLRRYRSSPLWGVALPAIAVFYLAATCGSAVRSYRGRGGHWKDRTYPAQPPV